MFNKMMKIHAYSLNSKMVTGTYYCNLLTMRQDAKDCFFPPSFSVQFLQHNSKAEGSELIEVVCKAYTGPNKPEACGQP